MNIKIWLIITMISSAITVYSMQNITLPSAQVLNERLSSMNLQHFLEQSKIDQQLGGQIKHSMGVVIAVELAAADYIKYVNNKSMTVTFSLLKPEIIKIILQDHPDQIVELQKLNLIN